MPDYAIIIPLFFMVAMVYASAGFGGGSSYLAILAVFSFDYGVMRSTALMCNIAVVGGSVYIFYKQGLLPVKKILPMILLSIPMAFWGGTILLETKAFFLLLGIVLMATALFMIFQGWFFLKTEKTIPDHPWLNAAVGGLIGFLSGIVGIGGGVFLSPVLNVTRWSNAKVIAATCSLFILVNSMAGLLGQISNSHSRFDWKLSVILVLSVFLGGQIGSRISAMKLQPSSVRSITALLVAVVAVRVLVK